METREMSSILDSGEFIEASTDIFAMIDIADSKILSRKYRRKCQSFHTFINKIFENEIGKSIEDEIEATLIKEYGLEHYEKWLEDKPTDRLPVKLTVSFDYGW